MVRYTGFLGIGKCFWLATAKVCVCVGAPPDNILVFKYLLCFQGIGKAFLRIICKLPYVSSA